MILLVRLLVFIHTHSALTGAAAPVAPEDTYAAKVWEMALHGPRQTGALSTGFRGQCCYMRCTAHWPLPERALNCPARLRQCQKRTIASSPGLLLLLLLAQGHYHPDAS